MSRRKPYRLLPPLRKKRRFWTAIFPKGRNKQQQCSTGTHSRRAAQEWAICWIRENSPALCAALDIRPLTPPWIKTAPETTPAPHPTLF